MILLLYISFRIKQYLCDFVLQTRWMAMTKGTPGIGGYKALFAHTASHGIGTLLIMLVFAPSFWWLGVFDFFFHALVDRLKGVLTFDKGWTPKDRAFWWSFGLDQEVHNFTHLAYIVFIVINTGAAISG